MNIVIVNDFAYVNGGAAKVALGSAIALAKLGNSVTLFTAVGPVASDLADVSRLQTICLGQREIVDNPRRLHACVQGLWNELAAARIRDVVHSLDRNHTIVHVHGWTKALSSTVVRAVIALGFRVVITLHDYFTACPTGTFYDYSQHAICPLRPMSVKCIARNCDSRNYGHKIWRVGRQWIQSRISSLPSGIYEYISISDLSERVLRPFLPATARIRRVPNFIDVDMGPPVEVGINRLFAYSGRLSAEKGPMLLAECSRDSKIDTLFIGDGPLRAQVQDMSPYASCTGWLPPDQATTQLRRSRALVFPALCYEGQPLVVTEAAAMGIPAIVPDTCAAREQVADGITGLWFRGGDLKDLNVKLNYLRENPSIASAMGRKAYERYWRSPATLDSHCRLLEQIYQTILEKP